MYIFFFPFFSAKDSGSVKKTKDLLNHHAFGTDPGKGMSQDYNKPLIIPRFSDSFAALMGGEGGEQAANMDVMKHHYTTHFPQSVSKRRTFPTKRLTYFSL